VIPVIGNAAILVGLSLGALDLRAAVGGRAELAVGVAPPAPSLPEEPASQLVLEPFAGGFVGTRRAFVSLVYQPRFLLRQPQLTDGHPVLILHRGSGALGLELSRRTRADGQASVFYGDLDYASAGLAFGDTSTSRSRRAVVPIFGHSESVRLTHLLSRRYRMWWSGERTEQRAMQDVEPRPFADTTEQRFTFGQGYQLTRIDTLTLPVSVGRAEFSPGIDTDFASAELGWERRLSEASSFGLALGGTYARPTEDGPDGSRGDELRPSGSVTLRGPLRILPGKRVTGSIGANVQGTPDPLLGTFRTAAGASASLSVADGAWTHYARADASTSVNEAPIDPRLPESRGSFGIGSVRRLSRLVSLELGVRSTLWGTHWSVAPFETFDREVLAFGALSAVIPVGSDDPDWVPGP
jgi:hypothetical protein